jgi:hypothetical protein
MAEIYEIPADIAEYRSGMGDNTTDQFGVNCARVGDLWFPYSERPHLGKWARLKEDMMFHQGRMSEMIEMLTKDELWDFLESEDSEKEAQVYELTVHLAKEQGLTESMKSTNFQHWVGTMNNCKQRAEEIIRAEMTN